jgi:hypothetical protein
MVITNLIKFVCEFELNHADFRTIIQFCDVFRTTLVRAVYDASRLSTSSTA